VSGDGIVKRYHRREVLQGFAALLAAKPVRVAGRDALIRIRAVSPHTVRITVGGEAPDDGSLVELPRVANGGLKVTVSREPLAFAIRTARGQTVQRLQVDQATGAVSFAAGDAPLLGLGEGGPQFDRRGSTDQMRSGQGGYRLRTHGGRVPIPWVIGTAGWAMFIHHPYGAFDFSGPNGRFTPANAAAALPLDIFFVAARQPATIMAEYARLTGLPELPPLWSFGYQQSHRTLASRQEILEEARTFREKKLPCDTLIYLGTGFCPSGWNTNNGEWEFNRRVFDHPKAIFDALHAEHFKVALHAVIRARSMHGTVRDACDPKRPAEEQPSCYWNLHRPVFALGVDGWWPDEGDPLDAASRLARNRMYWEAPQLDRPNQRPFALHRNGYAGMQRYASFLWSGDVYSTWETLRTHVPIAINTGLSGIPYWGTDIGGFVPTAEFSHELYVRWFQFGAFCTLFRAHGRTWKLRLPWGWNTGELGPIEIANYNGAGLPQPAGLHHAEVEPICRRYLELRYRMLPYLYSAVREATLTGMPVMRALWLHYPDDAAAVSCADEYLWGRDVLVAPVVDKGAASRRVYLPPGAWYDWWTGERHEGGRVVERAVDLETMPLYVRAGAIVPLGPVKQYTGEKVDGPLEIRIWPGADGAFLLYADDGASFNYRRGEWMGLRMAWHDGHRVLALELARASRMLPPQRWEIEVRLGHQSRAVVFAGRPLQVRF
jgi:alpha-glucosidase (family GH31 glycosyl hydrolase)